MSAFAVFVRIRIDNGRGFYIMRAAKLLEERLKINVIPLDKIEKFNKQPIIIIGSGESNIAIKDGNWLKDYFSISVNHSHKTFPSFINATMDSEYLDYKYQEVVKQKTIILGYLPIYKSSLFLDGSKSLISLVATNLISKDIKVEIGKISAPVYRTGILAALSSFALGFGPIIMVGFDASGTSYKYAANHPVHGKDNKNAVIANQVHFDFLKNHHKRFNLINCSSSNWAPQVGLKKSLNGLEPNKTQVVSKIEDTISKILIERNQQKILDDWKKRMNI